MTRPLQSRSSVAKSLAICQGCRRATGVIHVPSRIRLVLVAIPARMTQGSAIGQTSESEAAAPTSDGGGNIRWSARKTPSHPDSSATTAASTSRLTSDAASQLGRTSPYFNLTPITATQATYTPMGSPSAEPLMTFTHRGAGWGAVIRSRPSAPVTSPGDVPSQRWRTRPSPYSRRIRSSAVLYVRTSHAKSRCRRPRDRSAAIRHSGQSGRVHPTSVR